MNVLVRITYTAVYERMIWDSDSPESALEQAKSESLHDSRMFSWESDERVESVEVIRVEED